MKDNYERVYEELRERIKGVDFSQIHSRLGARLQENGLEIDFLDRHYVVNPDGIFTPQGREPNVSLRIVISHYLLRAGEGEITGEWASYRDFKDSAFFMAAFQANGEGRIAQHFAGKPKDLEKAVKLLNGEPLKDQVIGDGAYSLRVLPRLPVLVVFYDKDDDFPASCKLLFDRSAPIWLDAECMAVVGWLVAEYLIRSDKSVKAPKGPKTKP